MQPLAKIIQSCLARSAAAERLAAHELDARAKAELLDLASTWRQLAATYEHVGKVEDFLKHHHPAAPPRRRH